MVTLAPSSCVLNPTFGAASASIEAQDAGDILGMRPIETVDPFAALVTVSFPGASPVPAVKRKTTASPARAKELVATTAKHASTAAATARRVVFLPWMIPPIRPPTAGRFPFRRRDAGPAGAFASRRARGPGREGSGRLPRERGGPACVAGATGAANGRCSLDRPASPCLGARGRNGSCTRAKDLP